MTNEAVPVFPVTDWLDREIATMLARDARRSFRKIAADLGVAEGTVRGRVKRLQSAGLLKLTTIVDSGRERGSDWHGVDGKQMMFVTITCGRGSFERVRDELLAMPLVHGLYDANATLRLVAVCVLPTTDAAADVCNHILQIEGVRQAASEMILQTIKYTAAIAPIATLNDIARPQGNHSGDD